MPRRESQCYICNLVKFCRVLTSIDICDDCYSYTRNLKYPPSVTRKYNLYIEKKKLYDYQYAKQNKIFNILYTVIGSITAVPLIFCLIRFLITSKPFYILLLILIFFIFSPITKWIVDLHDHSIKKLDKPNEYVPLYYFDQNYRPEGDDLKFLYVLFQWPEEPPNWNRIREAVIKRDSNCCTYKNCNMNKNLQVHHIVPKHQEPNHHLSNLQTLCIFHHAIQKSSGHRDLISKYVYKKVDYTRTDFNNLIYYINPECPKCNYKYMQYKIYHKKHRIDCWCNSCDFKLSIKKIELYNDIYQLVYMLDSIANKST